MGNIEVLEQKELTVMPSTSKLTIFEVSKLTNLKINVF